MPSSWNIYYVVFLSAVLSLVLPGFLALVSRFMLKKRKISSTGERTFIRKPTVSQPQDPSSVGQKVNTRFFLSANVSLILVALMLILIPCVGAFHPENDFELALRGFLVVATLGLFAALALLYAARKGDLNWLKVFQKEDSRNQ